MFLEVIKLNAKVNQNNEELLLNIGTRKSLLGARTDFVSGK